MGRHSIGETSQGANIPKPLFHQETFRESACLEISVDPLQNLAPGLTCSLQQNLSLTRETVVGLTTDLLFPVDLLLHFEHFLKNTEKGATLSLFLGPGPTEICTVSL